MTSIRANIQSSSTATPILPAGLGSVLSRLVNRWVAGVIARSERQAARIALRQLDDQELKDIGISLAIPFPKSPANGCGCSDAV